MNITKLYFDMDGVLADFDRGVRELLGFEPKLQGVFDPAADDRLFAAIQRCHNFYAKLEPIPGMLDYFRELNEIYDCEILTGIPKPERGIVEASDNKKGWIQKYLGDEVVVHTVLRRDKPLFAKDKTYVLIDDFSKNIRQWERAGGTGILFQDLESLKGWFEAGKN